jgi:hypothetical protein
MDPCAHIWLVGNQDAVQMVANIRELNVHHSNHFVCHHVRRERDFGPLLRGVIMEDPP